MTQVDLGKIAFTFKGTYNSSTTYETCDVVVDSGNKRLYLSLNDNNINNPLTDTTNWALWIDGGGVMPDVIKSTTNPTITENLSKGTIWINETSGEVFTCVDDTPDNNIWLGQLGTKITPSTTNIVDFFNDGSGIALYQFDNNTNDTGGIYNGTPTNVTYDTGKFDQAAKFNGNAKIAVDFTSSGLKAVSFWYSASINDTTWHTILNSQNKNDNIIFAINNNNFSAYSGSAITIYTDNAIKDGNWHNVVLNNISGTNYDVWFDNTKVASNKNLAYALDTLKVIGSDGGGINEAYVGLLDEMRFFNRVLSDTEIQQLYNET